MSDPSRLFRDVASDHAEALVREGGVLVLDVRTPREYRELGHIPGASLLPVDLIPCALGTLPRDGKPLLVCCEHGIRSAHAARYLAHAGWRGVLNLRGGISVWKGPREHSEGDPFSGLGPAAWLVRQSDLLTGRGDALDVACGSGRHAFLLAAAGYRVHALDRDPDHIAHIESVAGSTGLAIRAEVRDLEREDIDLGEAVYDLILVTRFLHRPLFPVLRRALRPGGLLIYETFTERQADGGRPRNPRFLLRSGELRDLARPLEILREREGRYHGQHVAAVVARHPLGSPHPGSGVPAPSTVAGNHGPPGDAGRNVRTDP